MAKKVSSRVKDAQLLRRRGDFLGAEAVLRKGLAVRPDDPEILCELAALKADTGAFAEAHFFATSAIEAKPDAARAHALLGRILAETGSTEAALEGYGKAIALDANDAEFHFGRGVVLQRLGRLEDALDSYSRALAMVPDRAEAWCNHGNTLMALKKFEDALNSFDRGLKSRPDVGILHYNRASALNALGRGQEALDAYDRALALEPHNIDFRNNRGNTRLEAGDIKGAIADFRQIIAEAPDHAQGYNGLGITLHGEGDFDQAEELYLRALSLAPDYADVHHNLAVVRLYKGDFARAWTDYGYRCHPTAYRGNLRKKAPSIELFEKIPLWNGPQDRISGKIGIWYEQGIGDQVLFSTMIPELLESGRSFVYEVDGRLLPAYRRAFPAVQFVENGDPPAPELTDAAAAVFCGSLPGFFRTSAESFARQPRCILQADQERVAAYRQRIGDGLRIALSWRSAREGRLGRSKSVRLADFAPFLAVPGTRCVDVQYGDTAAERAEAGVAVPQRFDGIDYYNDLDEVLAILDACDLLITTSNANAHLAAALGKPVWLLYPGERAPFHYWAHGGDHRCLWYPSVEIVSAPELDDWPKLIAHAAEKLRVLAAGRG